MSDVIQAFLVDLGFTDGSTLTITNLCGLFILLLGLSFIAELVNAVIGGLRK